VLRDIGYLHNQNIIESKSMSAKEISSSLQQHQTQQQEEEKGKLEEHRRGRGFPGHTHGNLYTTTLHVINSAILKLGKLTQAHVVFRGISHRTLPVSMRVKDQDTLTRGGIEYGFTSCSLERSEANFYATADGNRTPVVLEMQQGMIDRGADLSWLSQYPHEKVRAHGRAPRPTLGDEIDPLPRPSRRPERAPTGPRQARVGSALLLAPCHPVSSPSWLVCR
jgi:hypothetical protein